ncbi:MULTISPECIES: cupin domain-containing protein [Rhodococcus]|uniref:Cupin domain-containing protein n=1 Tax=Rhodococcus jostii TaxID=132919 RepID=A0ABU4CMV7_RHOJO|nr:cupin domain-containing protein [Rhodococcus jostii]MDV6284515.1 cupin domain-containing protein [Rhodococcus jostii]
MASNANERVSEYKALGIPAGTLPGSVLVDTNEMKWTPFPGADAGEFLLLSLDPANGGWTGIVRFPPGIRIQMHLHAGGVDVYNLSGHWTYDGGDMKPGSYFYEPAGIIHEPDIEDDVTMFVVVRGISMYFGDDGHVSSWLDSHMLYTLCKANGAAEHLKHYDGLMTERALPSA